MKTFFQSMKKFRVLWIVVLVFAAMIYIANESRLSKEEIVYPEGWEDYEYVEEGYYYERDLEPGIYEVSIYYGELYNRLDVVDTDVEILGFGHFMINCEGFEEQHPDWNKGE